ncbi:hypothetical protein QQF21_06745 [Lelliottia sp. V89_10]|uniref:hypothetical protein n=1 Tax=Lelliottia wanjuensis TaxID=3050585 RepID=UPI00249E23FC|nr:MULTISPECIES: hypothetical protein [unclassified Lelliottia]MDI3361618.1 hypothetical protein [Lelliottia sp. V89_13]MDK9550099.1 hypothetical protein [Lelliottia sp. V89_5]MDK9595310.1 hypothetical protein [Lelliottia sp. V89_10]
MKLVSLFMVMRNYVESTDKFIGSGHITFLYGNTVSGNIAALGGNQGGGDFEGGTIKLSEYSLTEKNAKWGGKYQRFYKFYLPSGYYDNDHNLKVLDVDEENSIVFGISVQSNSNEGGGL